MTSASSWIIDTAVDHKTSMLRMARLVRRAITDPAVVYDANQVIAGVPSRDQVGQIAAIRTFLDSYFKFVPNALGTQTLRAPGWTLHSRAPGMLEDISDRGFTQGSCADAAILAATLGMANGIPAQFRAFTFCTPIAPGVCDPEERFSHVVTDLFDGQQWEMLDTTRPHDLTRPQDLARVFILPVA